MALYMPAASSHSLKRFFDLRLTGMISPLIVWSASSHTLIWSPPHGFWPLVDTQETFRPWTVPGTPAGSAASGAGGGAHIYSSGTQAEKNGSQRSSSPPPSSLLFHLLLGDHSETWKHGYLCIKTKLLFSLSLRLCKPHPVGFTEIVLPLWTRSSRSIKRSQRPACGSGRAPQSFHRLHAKHICAI